MVDQRRIEELEALREGWEFEAKLATGRDGKGSLPNSLWETYSAMANTAGGIILLGAREAEDELEFDGIADVNKVQSDLWNGLQNPQKVSCNLLTRDDVEQIDLENSKSLLLIKIPKAARDKRPVYIKDSVKNGTYLRVYEGDQKAQPDQIRRMLADSVPEGDSEIVPNFSLDDLHSESVRRFREFFGSRRPEHPFLAQSDEDFLVSIRAARKDRAAQGVMRPTLAGLAMLGKENSLLEHLPKWHVSYKELSENSSDAQRWVDHLIPDGRWNANLFQFYLKVIGRLHDGLKIPFAIEKGQYRSPEGPVHEAVREAFINALVHADLQGDTGICITKQRSCLKFENPGLLMVTAEQLWRGGQSVPRNPTLMNLFSLLGLGEREGSGGPTMRNVWHEQHWRLPRVSEVVEHLTTLLELPTESLLPESSVTALVERFGESFTGQNELGRTILVTAQTEGSTTHPRIQEMCDDHPRDITQKLTELVELQLLERTGKTRAATYLIPRAASLHQPDTASQHGQQDGASRANDGTSGANDGTSGTNDGTSGANDGTSMAALPQAVLSVQQQQRARPELVDQAILDLCQGQFLTKDEIADLINRSPSRVADVFIPRLLRSKKLKQRHPSRYHPNQAYKSIEDTKP